MTYIWRIAVIVSAAMFMLAATAFGQSDGPANRAGIDKFIGMLQAYEFRPPSSQSGLREIQELLKLGRSVIGSQESISYFNKSSDVAMISKMADIVTINVSDIRINAALILTNIAENRTICAVLDKLLEPNLVDNSRFNLLQVVMRVSNRLKNVEVKWWMRSTIDQNRTWISSISNNKESRALLAVIERNVRLKEVTDKLESDYPQSFMQCMQLKNIGRLPSQ